MASRAIPATQYGEKGWAEIQGTGSYTVYLPFVLNQRPLLQNGDFEAAWGDGGTHRCLVLPVDGAPYYADINNIFVPPGWVFWFYHKPDTWDQPEGRYTTLPERVNSGKQAYQYFTFWRKHDAGLYQQIQVTPGTRLRLSAWAHAWSSNSDDGRCSEGAGCAPGFKLQGDPTADSDWQNFTFRLGIDPMGGTDPLTTTVVWGRGAHIYNGYYEVPSVEATAQAMTVTLFLRSTTLWAFKHNDAYWDDVELVELAER